VLHGEKSWKAVTVVQTKFLADSHTSCRTD